MTVLAQSKAGARYKHTRLDLSKQCRLRVWFTDHDHEPLEYRADVTVAHHFAMAAHTVGAIVAIDDKVHPELRPLPCERLWHSWD